MDVEAFLFTSLLPAAPKVLLNVETGDYGVVECRRCGCGFEDLGFHDHIHSIRSFEKLTSEGMTLASTFLLRLMEEVLPSKYGGFSTDYQILEEEDDRGITRLNIIVSPKVGEIDEQDLLKTVLRNLEPGKTVTMISSILAQADTFRVKRGYPISTGMGKILPLRVGNNKVKP